MKKTFYILFALTIMAAACFFTGCYEPSPLYGAFADNQGNKITLMDDGTYSATIVDSRGDKKMYQGSYTVLENVISFTTSAGGAINSEWDVRGNMLYLTWTDETGATLSLTLYKTA